MIIPIPQGLQFVEQLDHASGKDAVVGHHLHAELAFLPEMYKVAFQKSLNIGSFLHPSVNVFWNTVL